MEWQPIETAPKDGTMILAAHCDPARQNMTVAYWDFGSIKFNIIGHWRTSTHEILTIGKVTHWMPLPEPPK